jgi:hypothetical protein
MILWRMLGRRYWFKIVYNGRLQYSGSQFQLYYMTVKWLHVPITGCANKVILKYVHETERLYEFE